MCSRTLFLNLCIFHVFVCDYNAESGLLLNNHRGCQLSIQLKHKLIYHRLSVPKVSKCAKIRNRNNQVPHLTENTNGKVTNSQLDITIESQEVSPFQACDHKAHINRRAQRHSKHKSEKNPIKDQHKSKIFL